MKGCGEGWVLLGRYELEGMWGRLGTVRKV